MIDIGIKKSDADKIIRKLAEFPNIEKAVLFGSRALGTHKHNSDIDIAIVGVDSKLEIERIAEELDQLPLPYKFDLLAYSLINNSKLKEHIDSAGIIIFER